MKESLSSAIEAAQCESNSPEQTYSPHDVSPINNGNDVQKHMAEKLVECTAGISAFKFDTITPFKLNDSQDIQINETNLGKVVIYQIEDQLKTINL